MSGAGLIAIIIAAGSALTIAWKLRLSLHIIRLEAKARAGHGGASAS